MARLPSWLSTWTQTRSFLKALGRIAAAQEDQAKSLRRLADHYAPEPPAEDEDLASTGVSYARDEDQGRILEYVDRMWREVGREPTAEEILQMLEDTTAVGREG
jgi:hypothetical protein